MLTTIVTTKMPAIIAATVFFVFELFILIILFTSDILLKSTADLCLQNFFLERIL